MGEVQTSTTKNKMIGMLTYKQRMKPRDDMRVPRLDYTTYSASKNGKSTVNFINQAFATQ